MNSHAIVGSSFVHLRSLLLILDIFGQDNGGVIRCDRGGELAKSNTFVSTML